MESHNTATVVPVHASVLTASGETAAVVTAAPVVLQETKVETKLFYKTSEFWMVVFTNLLAMGAQLVSILPSEYGIPLQGIVNMGYVLSRGIAKSGNPVVDVVRKT